MEDLLQVGIITATHGLRGEVKVFPTTDDVSRFKRLKSVILDTGEGKRELTVSKVRFFKNLAILKFEGLDDIGAVEGFRKRGLFVTRENAVELQEDEYFIADLIGLSVQTEEGEELGEIASVLTTGANDVYVIRREDGKELLLPAIHECVREVRLGEGRAIVRLLPGLREIYGV